jgi:lysophospholipase L1-like esterase
MIRLRPLLLAAVLLAAAAPAPPAARPLSRADLAWWSSRLVEKARVLRSGPVDLVWYGDSITQDWEQASPEPWRDFAPVWQRFYGDRHAVDLGFKGDTTSHLLWRIEHGEADGISPRAAVVLIGANNFGKLHWSAADTLLGIDAVIAALHRHLPHTRLVLLGVLPSIRSAWVDTSTATLNAALATRYAGDPMLAYVDAGAAVEQGGRPDPAAFLDGQLMPPDPPLHPTAQSQARIAALIEPAVAQAMGDHVHR